MIRPTSPEGLLVHCPGEGPTEGQLDPDALVSIQDCPDETEMADPATYIDGAEVPIWLLHGLADPSLPFNQSQLVYDATSAEGNEARLTFVPGAGHAVLTSSKRQRRQPGLLIATGIRRRCRGSGPSWDEIEEFIAANLF